MRAVEHYKYLWDGSSAGWVLIRVNDDRPDEQPRYVIFNTETNRALLIEDDVIYAEVKEMMIAARARIISREGA